MNTKIEKIKIIGIAVRTTNENGKSADDIGQLWNQLMAENKIAQIPNKVNNTIYSIYTDYESDYTKPYTTILGCEVSDFDNVPEGMVAKIIGGGEYKQYTAKGNLKQGVVYETWTKIWNEPLERVYTTDFEVYGPKAQNPENAEVDIFVAIKS